MLLSFVTVMLAFLCASTEVQGRVNTWETPEYLRQSQREELMKATKLKRNYRIAKNLVLAVGDGMGMSTLTAGRIYKGQKKGLTGEECKLSFEDFPAVGLSKTYTLDTQVPDSAGTAVAMMTGIKVNSKTLGVDGRVPYGDDCSAISERTKLKTLLDFALEDGKSVGLVTTTGVTHATPGASYAHIPNRDFECDVDMKDAIGCEDVKDIARQLVEDNPNINVILGGGRRGFLNKTTGDSQNKRMDGRDLITEWKNDKVTRQLSHEYVSTRQELNNVDPSTTDYLLGLFSDSHMDFELDRGADQPSLDDMTRKAIEILKKNPKGFFLLLEGGRIDHGHHNNQAHLALSDTEMFATAVETVVDMTSDVDTLVTVTADHSHVFTMAGDPARGNGIFAPAQPGAPYFSPLDDLPYLTLGYANGPGGRINGSRVNYTGVDTTDVKFRQPADVKMLYETHGGEDVAIFGKGPMSHLFHTTHEQSYIAHVMMYSACIGDYRDHALCDWETRLLEVEGNDPNAGHAHSVPAILPFGLATLVALWLSSV